MRRVMQLIRFVQVALAARTIQDFLWGGIPAERVQDFEVWMKACQKRIDRISGLDRSNGSWRVEARKRLLQLATLSVAAMEWIDAGHGGTKSTVLAEPEREGPCVETPHYVDPFSGASWPAPWWPRA